MDRTKYEMNDSENYAPRTSTCYFDVEVRSDTQGERGIFAREFVPAGAVVARDGGRVVTSIEDVLSDRNYVALIGEGLWLAPLDAENLESIFYLNHSCESNVARIGGLVYVAKRDIEPGQQLTIDYAPLVSDFKGWKLICQCGSEVCRKVITSLDWMEPRLARELWTEWLPYVQKKIRGSAQVTFQHSVSYVSKAPLAE